MLQTEPLTGKRLGDYQIERLLGQSQLGAAYLAQQVGPGRRAMVTTFHVPEGLLAQEQDQLRQRVAREGEALTRLNHPHILPVYGCGLQSGYVYLITAFAKEVSLNQLLKQNQRFSPQQVLPMLKQLADALDYARGQGIFHGMLSLSNVIVSNELNLRIAGFGLRSVLEMYENTQHVRPLDHLSAQSGALLGDAGYVSPERVLGLRVDALADVYALGVILFTLLCGSLPFSGEQPLDVAIQRLQQPVPVLHTLCSDVPEALDVVIAKMLERDPARRTQYTGEAALSFERALKTFDIAQMSGTAGLGADTWMKNAQITIPPTINWFDEAIAAPRSLPGPGGETEGNAAFGTSFPVAEAFSQAAQQPASLGGTDPFLWWSSASTGFQTPSRTPGTFAVRPGPRAGNSRNRTHSQQLQPDRRKLIKLLAVGGAAVGVVAIGGVSLARLAQNQTQALSPGPNTSQSGSTTAPGSTATTGNGTSTTTGPTPGATGTPATAKSPTAQPTSGKGTQPTPTAQPKPTQPPPKPTPTPGHTGTVIGHTSQATNSAVAFTNPANGQASLLIRLASGSFVACEKACTHAGVPVNYSSSSRKLVCPAHNATFDPANGFAPTSPAPSALPRVSIRVNGDGTITTG
ncbi:MAG TPA: protein kinase [Ktedonobacteraceae bacterium]|jgi:serine/threonine protein kinase/nitrite reductase/ring-hydroxylating ferredoxin subunit